MIDNHKYYTGLSTSDLVELLAEATQQYLALPVGENERTLASYRELLNFLQKEIRQRFSPGTGEVVGADLPLPENSAALLPGC